MTSSGIIGGLSTFDPALGAFAASFLFVARIGFSGVFSYA
jgi:hypothetical protein